MSAADTTASDHAPIARWRVRDVVPAEVAVDMNETLAALRTNNDPRHTELSFRLDSVVLLQMDGAIPARLAPRCRPETTSPDATRPCWIIVSPPRDPAAQRREWDFWLEAINSMRGEPRPSTVTMMIQASTYWAGGKTPIASVEFCAFECTVGELQLLQTGGVEAMCASRVFEGRGDEIERLTLPLALAAQLRVAQRVAEQWRDEFDEWVAFPPYSVPPPEPTETPSVALNLGAWCDAIGAGIKHIVLDEVLQCGSHPRADASETIVNKDQPSRPLAQRLKRRVVHILRGFNRPRRRG